MISADSSTNQRRQHRQAARPSETSASTDSPQSTLLSCNRLHATNTMPIVPEQARLTSSVLGRGEKGEEYGKTQCIRRGGGACRGAFGVGLRHRRLRAGHRKPASLVHAGLGIGQGRRMAFDRVRGGKPGIDAHRRSPALDRYRFAPADIPGQQVRDPRHRRDRQYQVHDLRQRRRPGRPDRHVRPAGRRQSDPQLRAGRHCRRQDLCLSRFMPARA